MCCSTKLPNEEGQMHLANKILLFVWIKMVKKAEFFERIFANFMRPTA